MSASTERKNRAAAREAGTDKKTIAAKEAAEKARKSKLRWTLGTIGILVLICAILFFNSGLFYRTVPAAGVDGKNYSAATMNYYYGTDYMNLLNQYGYMASYMGLDPSTGYAGLASTECPMTEEGTWRDYFLDAAGQDLIQVNALGDYAAANGISLDDEDQADIDAVMDEMAQTAKEYEYPSLNRYLTAIYGRGVNSSVVRQAMTERQLAGKAYQSVSDAQTYSAEELEAEYQSYAGSRDLFTYASYYVATDVAEDADEAARAQALTEARATAEAILVGFQERESDEYMDELNAAVDHEIPGAQATLRSNVSGGSLESLYSEWMMDESRQAGDNMMVQDATGDGVTVLVFLSREDNHYPTVSVRHILVKAEASEDGTYTDEAKAAALAKAEDILAQWKAGEATEDSFAALANELSEDQGSNTNGGLYEEIYKGEMVTEFNDFCFGDRQPGDVEIVYGESGSYAGYHVVYFVGEGEQYSDVIARNSLLNTYMTEWLEGLTADLTVEPRFGYKLVG